MEDPWVARTGRRTLRREQSIFPREMGSIRSFSYYLAPGPLCLRRKRRETVHQSCIRSECSQSAVTPPADPSASCLGRGRGSRDNPRGGEECRLFVRSPVRLKQKRRIGTLLSPRLSAAPWRGCCWGTPAPPLPCLALPLRAFCFAL